MSDPSIPSSPLTANFPAYLPPATPVASTEVNLLPLLEQLVQLLTMPGALAPQSPSVMDDTVATDSPMTAPVPPAPASADPSVWQGFPASAPAAPLTPPPPPPAPYVPDRQFEIGNVVSWADLNGSGVTLIGQVIARIDPPAGSPPGSQTTYLVHRFDPANSDALTANEMTAV